MSNILDHCAAYGCKAEVGFHKLMCRKHWYMVPPKLRNQIYDICTPGESVDSNNSDAWLKLAVAACLAVAVAERVFDREEARNAYKRFADSLKGNPVNSKGEDSARD